MRVSYGISLVVSALALVGCEKPQSSSAPPTEPPFTPAASSSGPKALSSTVNWQLTDACIAKGSGRTGTAKARLFHRPFRHNSRIAYSYSGTGGYDANFGIWIDDKLVRPRIETPVGQDGKGDFTCNLDGEFGLEVGAAGNQLLTAEISELCSQEDLDLAKADETPALSYFAYEPSKSPFFRIWKDELVLEMRGNDSRDACNVTVYDQHGKRLSPALVLFAGRRERVAIPEPQYVQLFVEPMRLNNVTILASQGPKPAQ